MSDTISRQAAIDAIVARTIGYTVDEIKAECEESIFKEYGYLGGLKDAIESNEEMSSAQPEPPWILVTEQMPERNLVVLVTTRWGEVTEGVKLSGNAWFIGRGEDNAFDSDILAWMPKPEPYAERRTDE